MTTPLDPRHLVGGEVVVLEVFREQESLVPHILTYGHVHAIRSTAKTANSSHGHDIFFASCNLRSVQQREQNGSAAHDGGGGNGSDMPSAFRLAMSSSLSSAVFFARALMSQMESLFPSFSYSDEATWCFEFDGGGGLTFVSSGVACRAVMHRERHSAQLQHSYSAQRAARSCRQERQLGRMKLRSSTPGGRLCSVCVLCLCAYCAVCVLCLRMLCCVRAVLVRVFHRCTAELLACELASRPAAAATAALAAAAADQVALVLGVVVHALAGHQALCGGGQVPWGKAVKERALEFEKVVKEIR